MFRKCGFLCIASLSASLIHKIALKAQKQSLLGKVPYCMTVVEGSLGVKEEKLVAGLMESITLRCE
ncbi:hypothetical protein BH14050 [Bartonella henselae str. Houston-1]|uniref:Uncharacterized protein n=1 Tax=Bartonella henselae (strain ATCC 49882 / DSM 28221 / CCUG 30454 / Houston 1) TaxID=283166 RepID=A0A0H3LYC6_BARHE|nr:hypothetical protein BH14050 [Bartonella henselae str. Houston-1]